MQPHVRVESASYDAPCIAWFQLPSATRPCLCIATAWTALRHDEIKPAKRNLAQAVTQIHGAMLEPDPAITLTRINAYTGEFVRTVVWPPHSNEVVFTAGSVIVAMQAHVNDPVVGSGLLGNAAPTQPGPPPAQRFFMGHTGHVVALAFDAEGAVMASAQEGKHAVVRVWDFKTGQCVAILNGEGDSQGQHGVAPCRDACSMIRHPGV